MVLPHTEVCSQSRSPGLKSRLSTNLSTTLLSQTFTCLNPDIFIATLYSYLTHFPYIFS
jgi:hypothetical protein